MKEDSIELTLEFDGLPIRRETDSPSLSLLRPFRRIAESGKPTGRINYAFFQDDGSYYIVGSLCYSPEKCLLFFPGLVARSITAFRGQRRTLQGNRVGMIDHLTLEPSFDRGHATTSTNMRIKHRIKRISASTWFWFAMSASPTALEPLYSKVKFSFRCPPSDSERRITDIMKARENAIFHLTSLPDSQRVDTDEFLNFEFFVGPSDKFFGTDFPLVLPLSVIDGDTREGKCPVRVHPVRLEGLRNRVWIRVSKQLGKLQDDAQVILAEKIS